MKRKKLLYNNFKISFFEARFLHMAKEDTNEKETTKAPSLEVPAKRTKIKRTAESIRKKHRRGMEKASAEQKRWGLRSKVDAKQVLVSLSLKMKRSV